MRTSGSRAIMASIRWRCCGPSVRRLTRRPIVSGGSTLTMQLARLMEPGHTLLAKAAGRPGVADRAAARQAADPRSLSRPRALWRQCRRHSRRRLAWFGKEPLKLTLAEAALLVALPQLPERRRPDRDADAALPRATGFWRGRWRRGHRVAPTAPGRWPSRFRRSASSCRSMPPILPRRRASGPAGQIAPADDRSRHGGSPRAGGCRAVRLRPDISVAMVLADAERRGAGLCRFGPPFRRAPCR